MASIIASLPPPLLAAHGRNNTFFRALPKLPVSPIRERQNRAAVVVKATGESSESLNSLSIVKSVQNVVALTLCVLAITSCLCLVCVYSIKKALFGKIKSCYAWWDNSEDRPGLFGLGFAAIVAFWASSNLITAIDKLPLIPSVLEFVGILYSSWFIYRYLLFKPDREEFFQIVNKSISDILGQ